MVEISLLTSFVYMGRENGLYPSKISQFYIQIIGEKY